MAGARSCADLDLAQRLLTRIRHGENDRHYRIGRIQTAIRAETYENDLKLSVAVDRLLCRMGAETVAS
jgi:hypothetical protein